MSNIKTGGPAFPQNTQIVAPAGQVLHQGFMGGMTLRDYFAAKAMQGMLACSNLDAKLKADAGLIATSAYQFADAMLKAREV